MSWITRAAGRAGLAAGTAAALLGLLPSPASAAAENVKYYTVTTSYNGSPENLTEIAARLLGSGSRSAEIFNLNTGRQQPDGSALSDPAKLDAGWMLILPWDAVGGGVRYGVLPDKAPATGVSAAPAPKPSATSKAPTGGSSSRQPAVSGPTTPENTGKTGQTGESGTSPGCATASSKSSGSDCATLRLAPDQAWSQSEGRANWSRSWTPVWTAACRR